MPRSIPPPMPGAMMGGAPPRPPMGGQLPMGMAPGPAAGPRLTPEQEEAMIAEKVSTACASRDMGAASPRKAQPTHLVLASSAPGTTRSAHACKG